MTYSQNPPSDSKHPQQPPCKHLVCVCEKDWKSLLHGGSLHHSGPPKYQHSGYAL